MHTLVLGASLNPGRASNQAIQMLVNRQMDVTALGIREGKVAGINILHGQPTLEDIHTVTLYLNKTRQVEYYDYILGLNPKRVIFNPGTENAELVKLAKEQGVEVEIACTLVMLTLGEY